MTATKPIHELLQMTIAEYDDFVFERYMRWCMSKVDPKRENDLQQLLANSALSKWFITEFARHENSFAKMVENTHSYLKAPQIRTLYTTVTIQVYEHYPRPLMEAARNINIINPN